MPAPSALSAPSQSAMLDHWYFMRNDDPSAADDEFILRFNTPIPTKDIPPHQRTGFSRPYKVLAVSDLSDPRDSAVTECVESSGAQNATDYLPNHRIISSQIRSDISNPTVSCSLVRSDNGLLVGPFDGTMSLSDDFTLGDTLSAEMNQELVAQDALKSLASFKFLLGRRSGDDCSVDSLNAGIIDGEYSPDYVNDQLLTHQSTIRGTSLDKSVAQFEISPRDITIAEGGNVEGTIRSMRDAWGRGPHPVTTKCTSVAFPGQTTAAIAYQLEKAFSAASAE